MITIDTTNSAARVVFTLTETTTISNPSYLLVFHSPYSSNTYKVILPENTSNFKERYDEFILDTDLFKDIDAGVFYYSVYQSAVASEDETLMGKAIENGLLKITHGIATSTDITYSGDSNGFITYEG